MDLEVRPVRADELRTLYDSLGMAFSFGGSDDDFAHFRATAALDRSRCAFEGGRMVGTLGAYPLDLTVPGSSLPTAGTTWVTVLPTHRRRGVMRQMLRAHLEETHERGEALAALWASEAGIYERFGYGIAAHSLRLELDSDLRAFSHAIEGGGTIRLLDREEAAALLPPLYERARRARPGCFARSAGWWEHRWLADPPYGREGGSKARFALYEEGPEARGLAVYRTHRGPPRRPRATLTVLDMQALDGSAEAALWRFLLDVDLMQSVHVGNAAVDSLLPHLLADPRQVKLSRVDGLWLRPVDVPAMLRARGYSAPGRLVLELRDTACPWNEGRWELEADGDRSECKPSAATPDIALSAEVLGAVYLGGTRLQTLARAGRVVGSPEALRQADFMFAWDPMPWCSEVF